MTSQLSSRTTQDFVPLLARVLHAAGMTGQDDTLCALGMALGEAVNKRDEIDTVEMLLAALQDIRRQHILVLRALAGETPLVDPAGASRAWTDDNVPGHVPMPEDHTRIALLGLVNAGLVRMSSGFGGMRY